MPVSYNHGVARVKALSGQQAEPPPILDFARTEWRKAPGSWQTVKMKRSIAVAALTFSFLVVGGVALGAGDNHKESLRGLAGVTVRVEPLTGTAADDGPDIKAIQADVEQQLKKAGINVLTAAQVAQEPGSPVLYVEIVAKMHSNTPPYAVKVIVALLQNAASARDASLKLREVKTWDAGYLTALDPNVLGKTRAMVGDLVNEFIADWRAVNKK
jgi:hypothetical protein